MINRGLFRDELELNHLIVGSNPGTQKSIPDTTIQFFANFKKQQNEVV